MEKGDLPKMGELFNASHASLRDDYEVSIPEIDLLVELVRQQKGVYGARITGGGFGGSIVGLVEKGKAAQVGAAVTEAYHSKTGTTATVLVP